MFDSFFKKKKNRKKDYQRHLWDSNPQSLPPESNALPLDHEFRELYADVVQGLLDYSV